MALIVPGIVLALVGIISTTYTPSSDVTVVAPMVVGFVLIALFGVWETFSNTRFKLCPPHLFASHKGREFTAPFIVAFIVTMFYYSVNSKLHVRTACETNTDSWDLSNLADHGKHLLHRSRCIAQHRAAAHSATKRRPRLRFALPHGIRQRHRPLEMDSCRYMVWNGLIRCLDGTGHSFQPEHDDRFLLYQC